MAIDANCGREVNPKQSEYLVHLDGKSHHFCCLECRRQFLDSYQPAAARNDANDLAATVETISSVVIREPDQQPLHSRQVAIAV